MKTSWSKKLFIACDVVIAVYLVLAFTSFDKKGSSKTLCSKVNIEIADNANGGFLDAKVIKERLQKTGYYPIGKPLEKINARGIEEMLRQSPFVKTAECYKTEGGYVYISVTQRMPVIRIKADNGDDYYVDDNDCIMPRTNYTSDLIIASGAISRRYAISYLSALGRIIMQNDLWKNLIEQIHILPDQGVELVPRIGDHIIYIGKLPDGSNREQHEADIAKFFEKKMTRLEKFYKYGLSQVGWNKYSYVNIEFDNQIICKRKGAKAPLPDKHEAAPVVPAPTDATPMAEEGPSEGETGQNSPVKPEEATQKEAKTKPNDSKAKPNDNKVTPKEKDGKKAPKESKKTPKEKEGKNVSKESKKSSKEGKKSSKDGKKSS